MKTLKNKTLDDWSKSNQKAHRLDTDCSSCFQEQDSFLMALLSPSVPMSLNQSCKNRIRPEHGFLEASEQCCSVADSHEDPTIEQQHVLGREGPITLEELSEISHRLEIKLQILNRQAHRFPCSLRFIERFERIDELEQEIKNGVGNQLLKESYDQGIIAELQRTVKLLPASKRELQSTAESELMVLQQQLDLRTQHLNDIRVERELMELTYTGGLSSISLTDPITSEQKTITKEMSKLSVMSIDSLARQPSSKSQTQLHVDVLRLEALELKMVAQMSHDSWLESYSTRSYIGKSTNTAVTHQRLLADSRSRQLIAKRKELLLLEQYANKMIGQNQCSKEKLHDNRIELERLRKIRKDIQKEADYVEYLCKVIAQDTSQYQEIMEENYELEQSIPIINEEKRKLAQNNSQQQLLELQDDIFQISDSIAVAKPLNDSLEQWNRSTRQITRLEQNVEKLWRRFDEKQCYVDKKRRDIRAKQHYLWSRRPVHPIYLEDDDQKNKHISKPQKRPAFKLIDLFFIRGRHGYRKIRTQAIGLIVLVIFAAVYLGLMLNFITRTVN